MATLSDEELEAWTPERWQAEYYAIQGECITGDSACAVYREPEPDVSTFLQLDDPETMIARNAEIRASAIDALVKLGLTEEQAAAIAGRG